MNKLLIKRFPIATALALLAILSACSSMDTPEYQKINETTTNADKDVVNAADSYMNLVFPGTRGASRQVKNISHMLAGVTRGNSEQDTLFSLVNYEHDGGFVLLAKKKNGYELYAIDDSHSMEFADTLFNEGLRDYLSQVRANPWPGTGADSTLVPPPPIFSGETIEVVKHGPYLNQYVSNWDQSNPYNIYCPTMYNPETQEYQRCVTGCVPLAVAMVMAYHRWPLEAENHFFDWNAINSDPYTIISAGKWAYEEIATLVTMLGNSDNLQTNYGITGSSTVRNKVPSVLDRWGYTSSGNWNNSTSADLSRQDSPAIMAGEEQESGDGHEWICDGRMYLKYYSDSGLVTDTDYSTETYFHFVWGWGGRCNGFYKLGSKTGVDGNPITGTTIEADHLFVHMKCLTDIKPRK